MRKLVVPAAVLAGLVMTVSPSVASAQAAPQPVKLDVAKACGVVTLTFTNPEDTTHGFRWNAVAGKKSTDKGARTGLVTVKGDKTVKETIKFAEDEFKGEAAVTVAVAFGPDSGIQPRADIYPVDTNCEKGPKPTETPDPTPTPPPTPDPTETPDPTTTPAPTTEAPPFNDLDCRDFPLADGRTAQDILNQTPTDDPNGLDADEDRIACEPGQDTAADGGDIADTDEPVGNVAVPSGGVATGGGPAWAFE